MTLKITSDFKDLEKMVSDAKPEDILETLKENVNLLYDIRGNLSTWKNPDYENKSKIWQTQENLRLLYFTLFKKENSDKIKKIYKLITSKESDNKTKINVDYSIFYTQLYECMLNVSAHPYGLDMRVQNRTMDFSDYLGNLMSLKHVLEIGPRDYYEYGEHEGILKQHGLKIGTPPEEH